MVDMRVAAAQVPVVMGDPDVNRASAVGAVGEAAARGADVVVLPECLLAGWLSPAAARVAEPVPGPFTDVLAGLARGLGIAIVAGLEERAGDAVHNSAVLVGRDGTLLARHRKIDELDEGLAVYAPGRSLEVVELGGVPAGLPICADSWAAPITDVLVAMGARLLLSPCAWAVAPGGEEANLAWIASRYAERTAGRELFVVAANGVGPVTQGPWAGKVLQGDSLIVGPDGAILARGATNAPDLLLVDLPL
jgi:predicted amidohydrolase